MGSRGNCDSNVNGGPPCRKHRSLTRRRSLNYIRKSISWGGCPRYVACINFAKYRHSNLTAKIEKNVNLIPNTFFSFPLSEFSSELWMYQINIICAWLELTWYYGITRIMKLWKFLFWNREKLIRITSFCYFFFCQGI